MKSNNVTLSAQNPSRDDSCHESGNTENTVTKKKLVNHLNFIHFQDEMILCHFGHPQDDKTVCLPMKPQPSFGSNLVCLWPRNIAIKPYMNYRFLKISIPNQGTMIDFEPNVRSITQKGFCLRLPESGIQVPAPEGHSRILESVGIRINTTNHSAMGKIDEINENRISIIVNVSEQDSVQYDPQTNVNIAFVKGRRILFTGQYRILYTQILGKNLRIRLEPCAQVIHRFPPKKFRSPRFSLSPSPDANFIHPFHGRYLSMNVCDLSGAGFSVENDGDKSALLTGMVIPKLELNFAGAFTISCSAQVVHRSVSKTDAGEDKISYGFAFIDMALDDHLKLSGILHQRENSLIRVCKTVDENALWAFFFETGFIYAKKYTGIMENKKRIRETYLKLYGKSPSIARHFTYQEKGEIVGHLSMLRIYKDAWLIHHHAALKRSSVKAGLAVLNHLAWFCYNSMWLDACHMRYMLCYFRPDNAFPNYFFKGFADNLNDPAGSSTDTFAYYSYRKPLSIKDDLPPEWSLEDSVTGDLMALSDYYKKTSGGLMIDALDLSPSFTGCMELEKKYCDAGLKKERHLFSLKKNGCLKAIAMVNVTDIAINLSDLSNCITLMVINEEEVSPDVVSKTIQRLSTFFDQKRFPILLYPLSFADKNKIAYQKQYILWILATKYSDHYFEFLEQINKLGNGKH
ncbi:MAG: hypothetical protein KKD44_13755 [Proteobacteria bacterium]|nr:hypothetical protein [Pseudomonadota bacterium]